MLAILGSVLGFATSLAPRLLERWQDVADKKHELKMIEVQAKAQATLGALRLEEMHVEADIRESEALLRHDAAVQSRASQGLVNLAASVRPLLTYLFFLEFVILTFLMAFDLISADLYMIIWSEPMQAIFAAVVSFWFGSRTLARKWHT